MRNFNTNKFSDRYERISSFTIFDACECSIAKLRALAGNSVLSGFFGDTNASVRLNDNAAALNVTQIGLAGEVNLEKWYVDCFHDSNRT